MRGLCIWLVVRIYPMLAPRRGVRVVGQTPVLWIPGIVAGLLGAVLWILYAWLIEREVNWRRALGTAIRIGVLTLVTSLWWIAGLEMQGTYGLDVLKYTETVKAVATASFPNEILRGLGYWFFYGGDRVGPNGRSCSSPATGWWS